MADKQAKSGGGGSTVVTVLAAAAVLGAGYFGFIKLREEQASTQAVVVELKADTVNEIREIDRR